MARSRRPGGGKPRKVGDWKQARRVMPGFDQMYRRAEINAVRKEAEHFRTMVLRAFKSSGGSNGTKWEANSPFTKGLKKSSKPLIDSGDLMASVTIIPAGTAAFFVGVPNNARSKDGSSLAQIGAVHEFGKVIVMQITKKQHAYFMAKIKELGGGGSGGGGGGFKPGATLVIKIPQRSFLEATKKAHFDGGKSQRRVKNRISSEMRRHVGTLKSNVR